MPNTFIDNRDAWLRMSETDYISQFVKTWLAFNAWYRSAYAETTDRKIINEIKWEVNPVLSRLRPVLTATTEESEQFRGEIGALHHRLQNYELHTGKGSDKDRITLENVYLCDNPPVTTTENQQGYQFTVERHANGEMHVEVQNRRAVMVLNHTHARHDFAAVVAQPGFARLSRNLKGYLGAIYHADAMKPKLIVNITTGKAAAIKCGSYEFCCGPDQLFAGVVEIIYRMRCSLFHGELNPTKEANGCYEPAHQLVRRFLGCIA